MMKDSTRVLRRPRRALAATTRTAAAIIAAATLVLPAAVAWGSSRPSSVGDVSSSARAAAQSQPTNIEKALAYSRCMRAHGVRNFPDPDSNGEIPKASPQELSRPQFKAAEKACQNLLPPGSDDVFPPGEVQQLLIGMLRFSQCMRSHGVPNWPDPTTDSEGRPEFPLEEVPDTNRSYWHQPRITHVGAECQYLLPSALGGTPIG
jgi:hypothetical protein